MDTTQPLNDLISRVALHDRQALRELYDETASRLLAVAQRMLRDRAAAEDVLQDVFITVWSRAGQYPAVHTHPMAWLTSMVRNRAIDLMRRSRPEVPLQWQDADGEEHHHDVADPSGTPMERLLAAQSDEKLSQCIGLLDAEPRLAVMLAYYEGLTHADLAQRLARPLGTIKAWVRRSLLRLKDCLGEPA
ncbi:MAG TPA: sigma-70 family RNA polymerase sigma factor [Rhizobacter sp.]|nr:sigma-70 family RNA polymerase sigma factor [Rhizobacter sp.]